MKIISIILTRRKGGDVIDSVYDLNQFGFFERGTVKELLVATSKIFVEKFNVNTKNAVPYEQYKCFVDVREEFGGVVFTDQEYPDRVAARCLSEMMMEYLKTTQGIIGSPFPGLQNIMTKYGTVANVDKTTEIQGQINDITIIMHKNIDAALQNMGKMEDLLQQSNDLSAKSKLFLKQAKKANRRCCILQ
ncbi:synaptobrevin domain-containing protein [Cavenderia fasciculata]|uniref:Synaptobrevin domain-containing protein n=1 Tax=Cavenderia fasciculata TaxID=261658 RepID=F4PVG9_CACFS|nr:synaptobrevin domain-containing protein [Cavenderia fasciculata]EGG19983.1 synaptobrevin domain-containing protein [Cavenderia fasciculata]|eukprot:XP_004366966.1 synaptobrevin domain-containing protein [Cavenderia fasciculata]